MDRGGRVSPCSRYIEFEVARENGSKMEDSPLIPRTISFRATFRAIENQSRCDNATDAETELATFRDKRAEINGETWSDPRRLEANAERPRRPSFKWKYLSALVGALFFIKKLCCSSLSKRRFNLRGPSFPLDVSFPLDSSRPYSRPCVYLARTRSSRLSFPIVVESERTRSHLKS